MSYLEKIIEDLNIGNLVYPRNDKEAYTMYHDFNNVYNKLELFKYQKINCNPLPILPDKNDYPVVIKPIINLYGMGLNSIKINNEKEIVKYKKSGFFWCKFVSGKHISYDLIVNKGVIIYHCAFEGIKHRTFGMFKKWTQIDISIPNIIKKYIKDKLLNYTGSVNIEVIGETMIEVHLRMGDIDFCHDDILKLALLNINNKHEQVFKQLEIIKKNKYKPIYLIPLWLKTENEDKTKKSYDIIEQDITHKLEIDDNIIGYYFDEINHPNPNDKYRRWLLLIGHDEKYLNKQINKYRRIIKTNLSKF